MIVPVKDLVFQRGIRDPNSKDERAPRFDRMTWTKERPFVVVQSGQWLVFTGKYRTVRTPLSNVVDAVDFEPDEVPAEVRAAIEAEQKQASSAPAQKGGGR